MEEAQQLSGGFLIYLNTFCLPDPPDSIYTDRYRSNIPKNCINISYPIHIFVKTRLPLLEFSEITIFYGSNGSGKSTLLNVIGEKLGLKRETNFSTGALFEAFVQACSCTFQGRDDGSEGRLPPLCRAIASDDIFDYLLARRQENEIIQEKRDEVLDVPRPFSKRDASEPWQLTSLKEFPKFKRFHEFRKQTRTRLLQKYAGERRPEGSNGQTALQYFRDTVSTCWTNRRTAFLPNSS